MEGREQEVLAGRRDEDRDNQATPTTPHPSLLAILGKGAAPRSLRGGAVLR